MLRIPVSSPNDEEILAQLELPKAGEHAAFMGNTGEGKSGLALSLFDAKRHGIIVNTKHDPLFARICDKTIRNDSKILAVKGGKFNYEPSKAFLGYTKGGLKLAFALRNRFFEWALEAGKRVVYIDEFNDICPNASVYPLEFQRAIKQGRWHRLSIWGSAQEPIRVPSFVFGQSQHKFVFFLGWPPHRRLAEEWFQRPIAWDRIPERSHKFYVRTPSGVYGPQPKLRLPHYLRSER